MEMNFKKYIESYAEMGFHLGSENVFDAIEEISSEPQIANVVNYGKKAINLIDKADKYIGMKKMFLLFGPTTNAILNSGLSLSTMLKRPKKLSSWVALRDDAIELAKLAAMNPLIAAPVAMGVSYMSGLDEKQETIIILTKIASSIYFYLDSIVKMMENSKLDQVRKMAISLKNKVEKLMPKSELPH